MLSTSEIPRGRQASFIGTTTFAMEYGPFRSMPIRSRDHRETRTTSRARAFRKGSVRYEHSRLVLYADIWVRQRKSLDGFSSELVAPRVGDPNYMISLNRLGAGRIAGEAV